MILLKKRPQIFYNACTGNVIPLDSVKDPVFSQKILGDGFAINPVDNKIFSPVSGSISTIFPTKHAIGIKTDTGLDILVHMGIDTVELNGHPFDIFVNEGDKVTNNTQIANVDLDLLERENKMSTIMIIITNMEIVKKIEFVDKPANKKGGEILKAWI